MSSQHLLESPSPATPRQAVERSLTEAISPDKLHRATRPDDDETPPAHRMRRSVDVPRSGAVTPIIISPNQSRRTSLLTTPRDDDNKFDIRGLREERDRDRDRDKEKDKEKKLQDKDKKSSSSSTDGLRQSLLELSSFSADTTRQLDQTHYALLEKTSGLQVMVKALKDLAQASCDLEVGFERTARELETDITEQLRGIGQFESQQSAIETLQSRIHQGRQTVGELAARLDVVRKRVEGWERADRAWQEKTRKRLRITWAALSALVCVVGLLFMAFSYHARNGAALDEEPAVRDVWRNTTPEFKGFPTNDDNNNNDDDDDDGITENKLAWETPLADDEPLRIFDEL